MDKQTAYINGISYYLPEKILANEELNREHPEWSIEKISQKIGILQRHIAGENEYSSDMALSAIDIFFEEYAIERNEIDYLLFCTQSPDYLLPTTACILQNKANLSKSCGALDFNLGCSGYIYGLGLAKGLVESGQAKNILLVTSETYSKFINSKDKSNKTLFGDASSVTLVTSQPNKNNFCAQVGLFVYGTDGSGYEYLIVRNGRMKSSDLGGNDQFDKDGNFIKNDDNLYMDGKAIFNFTAYEVPPLIDNVIKRNNLNSEDIDLFIFHQANAYMLDFVRNRCKIPKDKFYISIQDVGNTVSSTIPIALKRAIDDKTVNSHTQNILLAGFGVGLSVGAVVLINKN